MPGEACHLAFWISSDQFSCDYWDGEARKHLKKAPECQEVRERVWTVEQAARSYLADQLREDITRNMPVDGQNVYASLLGRAFSEVNWYEIAGQFLYDIEPTEETLSGPALYGYGRAQAIDDGVLIDVSEVAKEAGIKHPTAVTRSVWQYYVVVPEGVSGQDEQGRLWNIIRMLHCAIVSGGNQDASRLYFSLLVRNDNCSQKTVMLKSIGFRFFGRFCATKQIRLTITVLWNVNMKRPASRALYSFWRATTYRTVTGSM